MNFITLKNKVKYLIEQSFVNEAQSFDLIENAESLIKDYLSDNPTNIDAKFMLALLVYGSPLIDTYQSIGVLKQICESDSTNHKALLILAYIEDEVGMMSEDTFHSLQAFKTDDFAIKALIELAESYYFFKANDWVGYAQSLRKSIDLYQGYANNYIDLGSYLIKHGNHNEGRLLIMEGEKNISKDREYTSDSVISPDEFIDYRIKGIIDYK